MDGVVGTSVGYTGSPNTGGGAASYSTVCAGDGNTEAVRVEFNPEKLSYDDVLGIFWANHNPCSSSKPLTHFKYGPVTHPKPKRFSLS